MENGSKNRSGGLQDFKVANKRVCSYASGGERCHVYLLDLFITKLPVEAFLEDIFYMHPLAVIPARADMPWFLKNRLGQNACSKMTTTMCQEAGIFGRKTNHSLRRTAATTLFEKGVPEKIIQGITGHRSTTGLRTYEVVSTKQKQAVSSILSGSKRRFDELMEEESSVPVKKPKVDRPVPTYMQNCVVNVYPNGSAHNVNPLQQNTGTTMAMEVQVRIMMLRLQVYYLGLTVLLPSTMPCLSGNVLFVMLVVLSLTFPIWKIIIIM